MENGILKPMLRSLLVSYLLSGLLLAGLAFALYKLRLKENVVNVLVFAVYFLTCLAGGLSVGKRIPRRRFFWGLLAGLAYFAILFCASWLTHPGTGADLSRCATVMGICAVGGMMGGIMS